MYDFDYHQPKVFDQAIDLLGNKKEAKLIAGGMSLIPTLKLRLARYSDLIDLRSAPSLQGITCTGDALVIGSMTRHATVAVSEAVESTIPALAALAGGIGDPLVRNRGTIGGSVANADPAADYPAAVLGLDAAIITERREISGESFFVGLFETALQSDEIITAVRFPIPEMAGYAKLRHPASRFALVGVFVTKSRSCVRVAVTGAGPFVFRLKAAEVALAAEFSSAALDGIHVDPEGLNSDIHASAEYRAHAIVVMAKRAVETALSC